RARARRSRRCGLPVRCGRTPALRPPWCCWIRRGQPSRRPAPARGAKGPRGPCPRRHEWRSRRRRQRSAGQRASPPASSPGGDGGVVGSGRVSRAADQLRKEGRKGRENLAGGGRGGDRGVGGKGRQGSVPVRRQAPLGATVELGSELWVLALPTLVEPLPFVV